jgi:hypothetical protein
MEVTWHMAWGLMHQVAALLPRQKRARGLEHQWKLVSVHMHNSYLKIHIVGMREHCL